MNSKAVFSARNIEHIAKTNALDSQKGLSMTAKPSYEELERRIEELEKADNIRNKIEKELQESEEKFRLAFHTSPDSITLNRLEDGVYIDINDGFTKLMGYTRQDVVGKSSLALNIWANPEDRQRLVAGLKEHGIVENLEAEFTDKNGQNKTALMSARILRINDEDLILSITRDITDRKQAEEELSRERERLASIIEGTNVGTWEWNVQTGETIFNERWAEIIGYSLKEISPVSIDTWRKFTHPDDLKNSGELLQRHFSGELDYYECEARMRHKNGEWVWVLDRGKVAVWTEDGKPLHIMGTHQDITHRKQAEAEREKLQTQLNQAQKMESVGRLAGGVAHDFNNMLGVILGHTELALLQADENHDLHADLKEIQKAAKRSADTTKQLLAVSDNGCGMDKDTLDNLFEPFFTTKEVGKGTGLGLATLYGVVKQNSGFINVYSEPGQGSTFNIYMPRLAADEDIDKAVPEKKAAAGGTETILLVEDEPTILRMTRMMLERKSEDCFGYGKKTVTRSCPVKNQEKTTMAEARSLHRHADLLLEDTPTDSPDRAERNT